MPVTNRKGSQSLIANHQCFQRHLAEGLFHSLLIQHHLDIYQEHLRGASTVGGLGAGMGSQKVLMSGWNFSMANQMVLHCNQSVADGVFEETLSKRFHSRCLAAFPGLCLYLLQDFCWRGVSTPSSFADAIVMTDFPTRLTKSKLQNRLRRGLRLRSDLH